MHPSTQTEGNVDTLLALLRDKLEPDGQNLACFLEGLYYSRYTTYWDYIQLDQLLHLQQPRTSSPDELIFVTYHQITELYFKLILAEIAQVTGCEDVDAAFFSERISRVNRYLQNLIYSFDIMVDGLDKDQFLKFRTALSPASGFQSHQFRLIEICSTGLLNLRAPHLRNLEEAVVSDDPYSQIYWKEGAMAVETKKKDMSLVLFERRYDPVLRQAAAAVHTTHLEAQLAKVSPADPGFGALRDHLRTMDQLLNIDWRLSHFRSAARHLRTQNGDARATGGTNWRQYLPAKYQRLMFFPGLWSEEEQAQWGRSYIETLFQ